VTVVDVVDEFRDREVQVRVALPMSIGGQVDGKAIHGRREVRNVVGVEANLAKYQNAGQ